MSLDNRDEAELRRKNRLVLLALSTGLVIPFLYIGLLAKYLPDWLDTLIVGAVLWICFGHVIPENVVGVFRHPEKKKAQPDAQHNAGDRPSAGDQPASDTPSSPAPRG